MISLELIVLMLKLILLMLVSFGMVIPLYAGIVGLLSFVIRVIRLIRDSIIDFFIRYDIKKLFHIDYDKIIKEVEISEKQKIGNVKYTPVPTLDQERKISEKFLNSDLIRRSNISEIKMEDVFEGEIESVPFISADLFIYLESLMYIYYKDGNIRGTQVNESLSLSGTYYYFDIPTIEKGVDIVLVPRNHFAVFIFLMLILLSLSLGIYTMQPGWILLSIFFIASLLIAYYFKGSKTESDKFNSYFVLKTNDEIKARKILTPAVIQSIIDLREKEGEIMIAIKEGQLHVFIKNKDRFEYQFNYFLSYLLSFVDNSRDDLTKMKENIAQEVRQEIDLIKRLLKSIRLKETLYKKGVMENKKDIMKNKKRITKNKKG